VIRTGGRLREEQGRRRLGADEGAFVLDLEEAADDQARDGLEGRGVARRELREQAGLAEREEKQGGVAGDRFERALVALVRSKDAVEIGIASQVGSSGGCGPRGRTPEKRGGARS